MSVPLGRLVEVNPPMPGFAADPDREVTFMPLECVWPDGKADTSRRIRAGEVSSGYTLFRNGDVLLPKITPTFEAGRVLQVMLATEVGAGTTELHVLRPRKDVNARFIAYVCRSEPFLQDGATRLQGVGNLRRVPADFLMKFPVAISGTREQAQVANFLDRETAQIDSLIQEQRRLGDLLRERRQASIDHLVWSGLRSGSVLVPSGVAPAPSVPSHWQQVRNKALFAEATQLSETGTEELLTVSHLTGITPRSEKNVFMIESESLSGYRIVRPGDLVINTMWAWMGALGVSRIDGVVSPAYGVYTPRTDVRIEPRYYNHLYRSRPYVTEMTRHSRGIWSSRLRLYPEVFLSLQTVLPPFEEQCQIADELDTKVAATDALIAESERLIELSLERRKALITAAVSGEIDVRDEVA